MQVLRWGDSLAVRLPAALVEMLDLREGDEIEIEVAGPRRFELRRKPSSRELLSRLRRYRGSLPKDFHFNRCEAQER